MLNENVIRAIFKKTKGIEEEFMREYGKYKDLIDNLSNVDKNMEKLKKDYEKDIKILQEIKDSIMSSCEHLVITHHADASGNNDSWSECGICGKLV